MTALGFGRLRRVMQMTPGEIAGRAGQLMNQVGERVRPPRPAPEWLPEEGGRAPVEGLDVLDEVVDVLGESAPRSVDRVLRAAESVMNGRYPILGAGWLELGRDPDWHVDPVLGKAAPRLHWSRVPYLDPDAVGDHKFVWELSRQQYLTWLGQAYRITGDERFAVRAWDLVLSWIDDNDPSIGINWASSLEVAFRAIAWCWLWFLASPSLFLAPEKRRLILGTLALHGRHVERYLSTYFSPNTHLTGEALALCYLGSAWPAGAVSDRWWRTGYRVLSQEFRRQVLADGMHFERSSCYHLYTLEFYLHLCALSLRRNGVVEGWLTEGLRSMAMAACTLRGPDGRMVNVGDDDGGSFHPLDPVDPRDPSAALASASILLGDPSLWPDSGAAGAAAWLLGAEAFATASKRGCERPGEGTISHLSEAGFASSWRGGDGVVVSTGCRDPKGRRPGHVHDDALSMELWLDGARVVADPGTYSYTAEPDRRRWYRSARAHNAVVVDGAHDGSRRPFGWDTLRTGSLERTFASRLGVFLELSESDAAVPSMVEHVRWVAGWYGVGWVIWDRFVLGTLSRLKVRFEVPAPDREARWPIFLFQGSVVESGGVSELDSTISPRYGRVRPSRAYEISAEAEGPGDLVTIVLAGADVAGPAEFTEWGGEPGVQRSFRISTGVAGQFDRLELDARASTERPPGPLFRWSRPGPVGLGDGGVLEVRPESCRRDV